MPTYVTRIVVTQNTDPPPPGEWGIPAGYTRWLTEWTKVDGRGREDHIRHALESIGAARRITMNLLRERPPGKPVEDVLTLIGFDEEGN